MKKLKPIIPIISILSILFIHSCKREKPCDDPKDPNCENYDPCYGKKPVEADFGIYEVIGEGIKLDHILDETDTILSRNGVLFKPKKAYDKVTWLIGAETLEQTEVYREGFASGWIKVTMIAEILDKDQCLLVKNRVDTLSKQFYVLAADYSDSMIKTSPWWGTWKGTNEGTPNDTFTVTWGYDNGNNSPWFSFAGLPQGAPKQNPFYQNTVEVSWSVDCYPGYKTMWVVNQDAYHRVNGCFGLSAIAKRQGNYLEIDYTYNDTPLQLYLQGKKEEADPKKWLSKKWIGYKKSNEVVTQ